MARGGIVEEKNYTAKLEEYLRDESVTLFLDENDDKELVIELSALGCKDPKSYAAVNDNGWTPWQYDNLGVYIVTLEKIGRDRLWRLLLVVLFVICVLGYQALRSWSVCIWMATKRR